MPEEFPNDSRPHFVIPYWDSPGPGVSGDNGNIRPLPGNIVSYLCGGIKASAYQPGERLDVSVEVHNHGGANTLQQAQVTVWWADPATGFVLSPDRLIGFQMVPVSGRGGKATSPTMSKEIPVSAPPHICLLARVSHQFDRAGNIADPVNDRHWAQRNLAAMQAQPGVPVKLVFNAGNPFKNDATFLLIARPSGEESLRRLGEELHAEPVFFEGLLAIGENEDLQLEAGVRTIRVDLQAGEQRNIHIGLRLVGDHGRGRFTAVELIQTLDDGEGVLGSLGVVLRG